MMYGMTPEPTVMQNIGSFLLDNSPGLVVLAMGILYYLIGYIERKKQEQLMSEDISQAWVDAVWRGYAKHTGAKAYKRRLHDSSK